MKKYEISFIVSPKVEGEEVKKVVEKYTKLLTDNGAEITKTEELGLRELAYDINDFSKGYYFVFDVNSNHEANLEFDRIAKIDENLLRHLTICA